MKKQDTLLGHSEENDGIEEYDNPLPDWWLGMFFFTIIFAVGYTVEYHFMSGRSQEADYEVEMAAAAVRWPQSEAPSEVPMDAASIAAGKEVYTTTCVSCHGPALEGGIGPNLRDTQWIHGDQPAQIMAVITSGVSTKGMPAWGPILGPDKVAKVAAFVISSNTGEAPAAPAGTAAPAPAATDAAAATEDPIAAGEQVFAQNCASCHAADLTGLVGPNLIDSTWIHGGEMEQLVKTITHGVPEKGMIAWGPILGETKISQVAQFVHSKGSNQPPGAATATN
jgi:cytochrome c oxidase cbb3-type subunit 3